MFMSKLIIILTIVGMVAMVWSAPVMAAESAATQRQLFREGARLWPVYCAQCHNARPGSEFAAYQWDAILMHMRTQANLPAKDARAVLEYLKASR